MYFRPLQAVFLGRLISIYQIDYQKNDEIYFYVFGILICSLITVLLSHPCAMMVSHLGLKYRVALTSLITEKVFETYIIFNLQSSLFYDLINYILGIEIISMLT